jgi:hypothetical protein
MRTITPSDNDVYDADDATVWEAIVRRVMALELPADIADVLARIGAGRPNDPLAKSPAPAGSIPTTAASAGPSPACADALAPTCADALARDDTIVLEGRTVLVEEADGARAASTWSCSRTAPPASSPSRWTPRSTSSTTTATHPRRSSPPSPSAPDSAPRRPPSLLSSPGPTPAPPTARGRTRGSMRGCPPQCVRKVTSGAGTEKSMLAGVDIGCWRGYGFSRSPERQQGLADTNCREAGAVGRAVRWWSSEAGAVAGWRRD